MLEFHPPELQDCLIQAIKKWTIDFKLTIPKTLKSYTIAETPRKSF